MKKTRFLIIITALLCLTLAACGGGNTPAPAPAGDSGSGTPAAPGETGITSTKDTIIIANKADVGTLAPYVDTSIDRARLTSVLYETLVVLEADGSYSPRLATDWEWQDDTHLVFKLREGVKFHNGEDFTADDVLFTLEYALKSQTSNVYASIDIENCKVLDDYTIEVALFNPDSIILPRFGGLANISILDRTTCEADLEAMGTNPVGTGPYKYKDWIIGDTTTLERYDGYWGEAPYIKTIIFRKVSEATQRVIELETGGVDFAYDIPYTAAESLKGSYTVYDLPGFLVTNLYFNGDPGKTLGDENLRLAIAYAIDYPSIIKGAGDGAGNIPISYASRAAIGANHLNPSGEPWIIQDVAKAKEYMTAAGYPDGGLTLNAYCNADSALQVASIEIIANQLKAIGIDLKINQLSLGQLIGFILDTNNAWDFSLFGNAEITATLQAARFDTEQCPFLTPHTAELQEIMDRMWACTDDAVMADILKELHEYVTGHAIIVPFYESQDFHASTTNLQGFNINSNIVDISKLYFN